MTTPDITTRLRESELLPCPFCGSDRVTVWSVRDGQQAVCKDCKATAGAEFNGPTDIPIAYDRAVSAWNRRAPAWQPIETAPKDGTPFLVYLPQATWDVGLKPTVTVMFWAAWENFASLYADRIGESEGDAGDWIPTHWMPLPATPSQIEEGK